MKIKLGSGLVWVNLLAIALILLTLVAPLNVYRLVLGVPFVLFFPGYVLMLALMPRVGDLEPIERFGLSVGMSLAVGGLGGIALNYSPWGITLESTVYLLSSLIFFFSAIALIRRQQLEPCDRLKLDFAISNGGWYKWLLVTVIAGTIGTLVYALAVPKVGEEFTEMYLLSNEGQAAGYSKELIVSEEASVVLGVTNHEHQATRYRVEVRMGEVVLSQTDEFELADGETYEREVVFAVSKVGDGQRVDFLLYKDGESSPYRSLHLFVDVRMS